jgi:hypothetical protein
MESMAFPMTVAVWVAELLQVAVTTGNADACRLLCSRRACEHIPLQHLSNMLMLAVQQAVYWTNSQRQQRMAVLQHVSSLFSRLAVGASREWLFRGSSDSSAAWPGGACVRQVLAAAAKTGDEQVLQEILGQHNVMGQLLTSYDMYILVLMSLRTSCSPRIIQLLCGLQLSPDSRWTTGWGRQQEAPAFTSMSVNRWYHLFRTALTTHKGAAGVSQVVQLLADWDPRPGGPVGGRYGSFNPTALGVLRELAKKIGDASERVAALDVLQLQKLGSNVQPLPQLPVVPAFGFALHPLPF